MRYGRNNGYMAAFFVSWIAFILAVGGITSYITYSTQEKITAVVARDGERVCSSSNDATSCKYVEYFENETFENTDSWAFGKFNSSDVHGKIREGMTCDMWVTGYRIPFLSWHRNIITADCW